MIRSYSLSTDVISITTFIAIKNKLSICTSSYEKYI